MIGAALGAYVLTQIDGATAKPFVLAYLTTIGLFLVWRGVRYPPHHRPPRIIEPLGLVGGFLDAAGGGGWGPVVTGNLLVQGAEPRKTIGTVNSAGISGHADGVGDLRRRARLGGVHRCHGRPSDRRNPRRAARRLAGQARSGQAAAGGGRHPSDDDQPLRNLSRAGIMIGTDLREEDRE